MRHDLDHRLDPGGGTVAKVSAEPIKRVPEDLAGQSANIMLPDLDLEEAVVRDRARLLYQLRPDLQAPVRMLVPQDRMDAAADIPASFCKGQGLPPNVVPPA